MKIKQSIEVEKARSIAAQSLAKQVVTLADHTGLSEKFCAEIVAHKFEKRMKEIASERLKQAV